MNFRKFTAIGLACALAAAAFTGCGKRTANRQSRTGKLNRRIIITLSMRKQAGNGAMLKLSAEVLFQT